MKKQTRVINHDSLLQSYFNQIKAIPLLTFEEEQALSIRIQQGEDAAQKKLVEANLRLVVKIAQAYVSAEVHFMDIIQEGNIGLMRAAAKFDHKRNVRFSTYANWWIRQSILRYLANKSRVIRLPHRKEEIFRKVQRAFHTLSQTLMHQPSVEEIARYIGVPMKEVAYILSMTSGIISLDMENGEGEASASAADLHEDYTYSPERALLRKSFQDDTMRCLDRLKEREKHVLMYRYQLNGCEHHTLKKISDKMGVSPETVRQIEIRALRKMRDNAQDLWYSMDAASM